MLPAANVKDMDSSFILPEQTCQRLTLAEIKFATRNFDETLVIGRGGFGKVYKCPMKIGSVSKVAIKRLNSMSDQGANEFGAEVKVLSKLRHANLVSLIGYCNEGKEMFLAYEFMPNGTLEDHLRKTNSALSWLQRLKICIGAARGLQYLHTGTSTQLGVIHRDVKTSNILLDANFAAKISDFGLAKVGIINHTRTYVSTAVKGTFGYMDPCYFFTGKLTRKSDVYAFGVVLLEVLSGRQAVDSTLDEDQWSLAAWAQDQMKKGKLNQLIDSRLKGQISRKCLKDFTSIAGLCLHKQPTQRPTMDEVVVKLESILSQEIESVDFVVYEGTFINKLRSFFTAKTDLIQARTVGSKSEIIAHQTVKNGNIDPAVGSNFENNAHHIRKSRNHSLKIFTYDEIIGATNHFDHKENSSTLHVTIYKGWVDQITYAPTKCGIGLPVYVRVKHIKVQKLNRLNPKPEDFNNVDFVKLQLDEFNHPNLVKLLGYCLDNDRLYCVYEHTPGTSLDGHLFKGTSLPWVARLKIAVGASQGLSFLHQRNHMAYSQFKTSVILLDKDLNARLSDFEVEKSFLFQDSYSFHIDAFYAAPEWFNYQLAKVEGCSTARLSECKDGFGVKSEVYAFGIVLLEVLTGMPVFDVCRPQGKQNLVKWAAPLLPHEVNLGMIVDPKLQHNSYPPKGAFKFALLVSNCLHPIDEKRPSMEEISLVLYELYKEEIKQNSYFPGNTRGIKL